MKFEKLENAYYSCRYGEKLKTCERYLNQIESDYITQVLFNEAQVFSQNTYNEICVDDFGIAIMNTEFQSRNDLPVENLKKNLTALKKMLLELIEKENINIFGNADNIKN